MRAAGAVAPSRWGASAPHSRDGYRPPPRVHGAIRGIGIPRRNPGRVLISKTRVFGAEEVGTIVPYALDVVTVGSALFSAGTTTDVNELPAAVLQGLTQVIPHPSFVSETARVLGAAIFDQHSVWWAIASPLFALSVAPYLLFLKRMYDAPSATDEMRASFATLLFSRLEQNRIQPLDTGKTCLRVQSGHARGWSGGSVAVGRVRASLSGWVPAASAGTRGHPRHRDPSAKPGSCAHLENTSVRG